MKPTLFLRIASVLTYLHAIGHTIGGLFGKPEPGPQQAAVSAMQTNQFLIMGLTRSFWNFYMGLSLAVSISLVVEATVFWQLSSLAKTDAHRLRPVVVTFLIGYLAIGINSYRNFFLPPVIAEILIVLCLGLALVTSRPATSTPEGG